jgi:hypothetical protein
LANGHAEIIDFIIAVLLAVHHVYFPRDTSCAPLENRGATVWPLNLPGLDRLIEFFQHNYETNEHEYQNIYKTLRCKRRKSICVIVKFCVFVFIITNKKRKSRTTKNHANYKNMAKTIPRGIRV